MNDIVGKVINHRYHVQSLIGRGGMAEVYKVWDQSRGVYLAMKVLREDLALDRVFMRRFKREAQTLSRLQHPNIVRYYGLEQDQRLAFILMDYVGGSSLRHEIFDANRSLTPTRTLEVMQMVCAALHYAHTQGFVHCDIKPANILIDKNGRIQITDFGISRMSESATATMVGIGSPAYMAPEQVRGDDPSPQTDIYALGVVLYEMLTGGERPFTGERARTTGSTGEKVRWEHMHLPPPSPRRFNPSLDPQLEKVLLRCLAKDPQARYVNAFELLNSLELAVTGPSLDESPPPIVTQVGEQVGEEGFLTGKTLATAMATIQKQDTSGTIGEIKQRKTPRWWWFLGGTVALFTVLIGAVFAGGNVVNRSSSGSGGSPTEAEPVILPATKTRIIITSTYTITARPTLIPTNTLTTTISPTSSPTSTLTSTSTSTVTASPTPTNTYKPPPTPTSTKKPKKRDKATAAPP